MSNSEPSSPRSRRDYFRAERIGAGLYIGPAGALIGLLNGSDATVGAAAGLSIFSLGWISLLYTIEVRARTPREDYDMVAAAFAWCGLPWAAFIFWGDALFRSGAFAPAVLVAMIPGAAVGTATFWLRWKLVHTRWRTAFLVSGGLVYIGWVAAYGWLVRNAFAPAETLPAFETDPSMFGLAAFFLLPAPFFAAGLAVRLLLAPLEPEVVDARSDAPAPEPSPGVGPS